MSNWYSGYIAGFLADQHRGFCVGNSWEYLRCQKVYISETRNVRVGQTVSFKHRYPTQPSITPSSLLKGPTPVNDALQNALGLLMGIFKGVNDGGQTDIDAQRAQQGNTAAQNLSDKPNELEGVWINMDKEG